MLRRVFKLILARWLSQSNRCFLNLSQSEAYLETRIWKPASSFFAPQDAPNPLLTKFFQKIELKFYNCVPSISVILVKLKIWDSKRKNFRFLFFKFYSRFFEKNLRGIQPTHLKNKISNVSKMFLHFGLLRQLQSIPTTFL